MSSRAPIVDQKLATLFASEPDPFEAVETDQTAAMPWKAGFNPDLMMKHGRLVALACGHFTMSKALHRAKCRRCGEMIRAGYDYDAFRNHGASDQFSWPGDPLRPFSFRGQVIRFDRCTNVPKTWTITANSVRYRQTPAWPASRKRSWKCSGARSQDCRKARRRNSGPIRN